MLVTKQEKCKGRAMKLYFCLIYALDLVDRYMKFPDIDFT